jgi:molybdopterin-guanine dinucleotide biosynthesis protein A
VAAVRTRHAVSAPTEPASGHRHRRALDALLHSSAPVPFGGVVLTGGLSTRMGTDKAFLVPGDGGPVLAERARRALADAGARQILAVGGDRVRLRDLGFTTVPDRIPGRGPLGGLISGLQAASQDLVVVLSCDLPAIDGATVTELVRCLARRPDAAAALPTFDGRCQVLVGAYRRRVAAPVLEAAFGDGERSIRRALGPLVIAPVATVRRAPLIDVDRPEDLDHYDRSRRASASEGHPLRSDGRPDVG